jgi:hypothetical protein
MKKFLVGLIIILILAAVAFFFGWIQLSLDENTQAVIFTKTGGWDDTAVRGGEFLWRWERLLPTNMTIYRFPYQVRNVTVSAAGMLPSGDVYASIVSEEAVFDYRIDLLLSYTINPGYLASECRDAGLRPEGLPEWYDRTEARLLTESLSYLEESLDEDADYDDLDDYLTAISTELKTHLETRMPEISISALSPEEITLPDFTLYRELRRRYFGLLDAREELYRLELARQMETQVSEDIRMNVLSGYGEILTEYPALLDYFQLDSGEDPLNIQSLTLP